MQRNFTDPESRIMPDGANKGSFVQGYNAQIAVDSASQVIGIRLAKHTVDVYAMRVREVFRRVFLPPKLQG
jgi:hypothetical protein